MDALYQVRTRKSETDLAIDQLRETLGLLAAERAPGISKLEKRLEEVRALLYGYSNVFVCCFPVVSLLVGIGCRAGEQPPNNCATPS